MGIVEEKEVYIKACIAGRITVKEGAKKIGYNTKYFYTVLAKYRKHGTSCLINGHKGMKYKSKKYTAEIKKNYFGFI